MLQGVKLHFLAPGDATSCGLLPHGGDVVLPQLARHVTGPEMLSSDGFACAFECLVVCHVRAEILQVNLAVQQLLRSSKGFCSKPHGINELPTLAQHLGNRRARPSWQW